MTLHSPRHFMLLPLSVVSANTHSFTEHWLLFYFNLRLCLIVSSPNFFAVYMCIIISDRSHIQLASEQRMGGGCCLFVCLFVNLFNCLVVLQRSMLYWGMIDLKILALPPLINHLCVVCDIGTWSIYLSELSFLTQYFSQAWEKCTISRAKRDGQYYLLYLSNMIFHSRIRIFKIKNYIGDNLKKSIINRLHYNSKIKSLYNADKQPPRKTKGCP